MSSPSVTASYRQVRRISWRSRSSFYRSFWLLPRPKRNAMCALYAFSRITDDLGDCEAPVALRTRWLEWWRETTTLNMSPDRQSDKVILADPLPIDCDPVSNSVRNHGSHACPIDLGQQAMAIFPALEDASQRFNIPRRYLLEIIDGVLADQQKTRFDTFEQLEHYCYLAASAVGLACLHIWEFEGEVPLQAAVDCGIAFHLTNILRDISEDAQRGKIYLPRQHYQQHGMCEDDLLMPRADDRLGCLISDEIERAKRLFNSGWQVFDTLSADGRPMFSMIWRTYRRLLDHIAANPRAVAQMRIAVPMRERFGLVSRHFIAPLFRRLPVPPTEVTEVTDSLSAYSLAAK